ncbi:hypothetical protein CC78DRAFT_318787 [Lojkania enalia]|uniref:DUF6604 domain-containing protein n=1 Tax=Lojkania enalia TaxID=147567 RepID=A0A9P4K7M5_9PLEO|nr:hypothetical protein CC78DRAFT_318787 [Didymosphaeria enalia]
MTGLSPLLYPTYLRHKKWLAYFLEWLAKTARSSGTVDDIFVVEQAQQNKGKQKGKKRQLDEQTTFEISLNSYIRLAEAVARDKGVIVPNQMIYFLRDIVRARKDCLAFYAYQGKGSQSAEQRRSSDSHIKAVEILKNVLQILEPLCPAADTKHQPDPKAPQQITNIYEVLPPEEPEEPGRSEWLPDSPAYQLPKKKVDYYQPKSSEGDKFFAIYCFLKDLSEIRFDVCRVWGEYKNRKISLSTAALTMSAAIEIFERLNNELLDEFPDFDDHRKIFEYAVKGHNDSKTNPAPGDPSDVFREHEAGGLKVSPGTLSCSFTIKFVEAFILSPQVALPFLLSISFLA